MFVLLLLLAFLLGVIVATKFIEHRAPVLPPPDSIWIKDRWYSADDIKAMSLEQYVELRPYLMTFKPEGWETIELTQEEIDEENERFLARQ